MAAIFKVMAVYIGSIIGAGFASGQEIMQFFIGYGRHGIWGAIMAGLLFTYLGGLVMAMSVSRRSQNYYDVLQRVLGPGLAKILDCLSLVMLPGGLAVMLAGSGAVFSEHLGLPAVIGTLCTAAFTCLVVLKGLNGVIGINVFLVPIKIFSIILVCVLALIQGPEQNDIFREVYSPDHGTRHLWSGILYVSYNMIVPVAMLSSLGRNVSLREGLLGGIFGGLILGGIIVLVTATGLTFYPEITQYQIPLLFMASGMPAVFKLVLGLLIWMAILTTSVADAHGFASRQSPAGSKKYKFIGVGIVFLMLPLSFLKFSYLVQVLYPLFGYAGLVLLAGLLIVPPYKWLRRKFLINR